MQWLKFGGRLQLPSSGAVAESEPELGDNASSSTPADVTDSVHYKRLRAVLSAAAIDESKLRAVLWRGVPQGQGAKLRPVCWKIALGLLPLKTGSHAAVEERRLKAWKQLKSMYFDEEGQPLGGDQLAWRQIDLDVRRTNLAPAVKADETKELMRRVLLIWAARHPASGYVQGLNDLLAVFVLVFLQEQTMRPEPGGISAADVAELSAEQLLQVEASSSAAFSELLTLVQDCFVPEQPGIIQMLEKIRLIVSRLEPELMEHLLAADPNVLKICCFRWINCLLVRELPLCAVLRLWDAYLAEGRGGGFPALHVYACSALLMRWKRELLARDFNGIAELLLHTHAGRTWDEEDVSQLLSEAHMLKCYFHDAPHHLSSS